MDSITKQLEAIKEELCDGFCKWTEKYTLDASMTMEEEDAVLNALYDNHCNNCPLNKL